MGNSELELQTQVGKEFYKSIGKKLLSGKEMGDSEKEIVFDVAVKFASDIVDENPDALREIPQINKNIRDHLNVIVLDRVVSLVQKGSSTDTFEKLKDELCDKLFIEKDELANEPFLAFLGSGLDNYFEKQSSYEVDKNMASIVKAVDRVVPARIKPNGI